MEEEHGTFFDTEDSRGRSWRDIGDPHEAAHAYVREHVEDLKLGDPIGLFINPDAEAQEVGPDLEGFGMEDVTPFGIMVSAIVCAHVQHTSDLGKMIPTPPGMPDSTFIMMFDARDLQVYYQQMAMATARLALAFRDGELEDFENWASGEYNTIEELMSNVLEEPYEGLDGEEE